MKYLRYFALLAVCIFGAGYSRTQDADDYGYDDYSYDDYSYAPAPVCNYGYYAHPPYACAPYGYWGPDFFVDGVFIGAGPWFPGWYGQGYYGGGGYGGYGGGRGGYSGGGGGYGGRSNFAGGRGGYGGGSGGYRGDGGGYGGRSNFAGGRGGYGGGNGGYSGGGHRGYGGGAGFRGGGGFHSAGVGSHGGGGGHGGHGHAVTAVVMVTAVMVTAVMVTAVDDTKSAISSRLGEKGWPKPAFLFCPVTRRVSFSFHNPCRSVVVSLVLCEANFRAAEPASYLFQNPRIYQNTQAELRRAQRRVARGKKGSQRRRRAVLLLEKVHQGITHRRSDFLHKHSTAVIRKYGTVKVEGLNVSGMSRGHLAKQILDCSWSEWFRQLRYKAAEAGRRFVAVDPKYTSQICSQCGFKHPDNRKTQADFACLSCGYQDNADHNAAVNISARNEPLDANVSGVALCVV